MPGLYVGYRKQTRAVRWLAKRYVAGKYEWQVLGTPDDFMEGDGVVLSYRDAVAKAQEWAAGIRLNAPRYHGDGLTVKAALEQYFASRLIEKPNSTSVKSDKHQADRHIASKLGNRLVISLNDADLRAWLNELAATPPTVRAGRAGRKALVVDMRDPVNQRRRCQTANRVWNIFRAALNHAWRDSRNGISSPNAWARVKALKVGDLGPPRMLENEEIRRLLNSAPVAFRPLLAAAFFTGARYGEVVRMRVRDFDADAGAVHIHQTKTGKTLCQPLDPEGYEFFISRTAGRAPESLMFTRDGSEQGWGKSHQARPTKEAAARAGLQDVSFKVTRATYGKRLLLATKDIELVAKALGHSDSRITRKHYAQYLPNEVAVGVRSMEPIGIAAGNVFPLRKQAL